MRNRPIAFVARESSLGGPAERAPGERRPCARPAAPPRSGLARYRLIASVACVLALGCADLDAEPAPLCTDTVGCPEGTRCVDGVRCQVLPGAQVPRSALRTGVVGGQPGVVGGPGRPGARRDGAVTCGGGLVECRGECVDVRNDPLNCGGCGRACAAGVDCRLGVCCAVGLETCGDRCVDLQNDPSNCGVCDFPCIQGLQCRLGTCQPPDTPLGPSSDPGTPGLPGEEVPDTPTPDPDAF